MKSAPEIIRAIAAGEDGAEEMAWLRERLADYVANPAAGLEPALWLDRAPGEQPWWIVERRRQRDDLLRRLAEVLAPGATAWAAADVVASYLRRYATAGWRHEQNDDRPPEDEARAVAWKSLKCGVGMPRERRQIYEILRCAPQGTEGEHRFSLQ
ncbi:MAG: hypothetical protein HQL38_06920 [Alphaproteobacteria bacterium]|nr:hypothetical protein [Alphaproteobacteria bacterium]